LCITLLLAGLLAIFVDPIVTFLERGHVSRTVSSAILVFAGVNILGTATYSGYRQVSDAIDNMPEYAVRVGQAISPLTKKWKTVEDSAGRLNSAVSAKRVPEMKVRTEYPEWTSYVVRGVGPLSGIMIIVGIVPFSPVFPSDSERENKLNILLGDKIDVPALIKKIDEMVRNGTHFRAGQPAYWQLDGLGDDCRAL
jgi:predicted PurR-regulated permease PerM